QTVLGFAVLADLRLHVWEAAALLALFALQFPFPQTGVRMAFAAAYAALAVALLVYRRRELPRIVRATLRPPAAPPPARRRCRSARGRASHRGSCGGRLRPDGAGTRG